MKLEFGFVWSCYGLKIPVLYSVKQTLEARASCHAKMSLCGSRANGFEFALRYELYTGVL